jgi:hypothetical protein
LSAIFQSSFGDFSPPFRYLLSPACYFWRSHTEACVELWFAALSPN